MDRSATSQSASPKGGDRSGTTNPKVPFYKKLSYFIAQCVIQFFRWFNNIISKKGKPNKGAKNVFSQNQTVPPSPKTDYPALLRQYGARAILLSIQHYADGKEELEACREFSTIFKQMKETAKEAKDPDSVVAPAKVIYDHYPNQPKNIRERLFATANFTEIVAEIAYKIQYIGFFNVFYHNACCYNASKQIINDKEAGNFEANCHTIYFYLQQAETSFKTFKHQLIEGNSKIDINKFNSACRCTHDSLTAENPEQGNHIWQKYVWTPKSIAYLLADIANEYPQRKEEIDNFIPHIHDLGFNHALFSALYEYRLNKLSAKFTL